MRINTSVSTHNTVIVNTSSQGHRVGHDVVTPSEYHDPLKYLEREPSLKFVLPRVIQVNQMPSQMCQDSSQLVRAQQMVDRHGSLQSIKRVLKIPLNEDGCASL
jgi:hypothetical protein